MKDSKLFMNRSKNELDLANIIFYISEDEEVQLSLFDFQTPRKFYSAVISHSYYSMFYAAKSYLNAKGIKTKYPNEHKKVFNAFEDLSNKGAVDYELFNICKNNLIKANQLLGIFRLEKNKRGKFTYRKIPQANRDPAIESLSNSKFFFKHMNLLVS